MPGRLFKHNVMFVGKTGAYPSGALALSLYDRLLALPANIMLGWKSLLGKNSSSFGQFVSYEEINFCELKLKLD